MLVFLTTIHNKHVSLKSCKKMLNVKIHLISCYEDAEGKYKYSSTLSLTS
jgi:hypothetical protein